VVSGPDDQVPPICTWCELFTPLCPWRPAPARELQPREINFS
jgi:hypothetical protein